MKKVKQTLTRDERNAIIALAEANGFIKCLVYQDIGLKYPRWYFGGGYYSFYELPKNEESMKRFLSFFDFP